MLVQSAKKFLTSTTVGRHLLMPYRFVMAVTICTHGMSKIPAWVLTSRELNNLSYDVTPRTLEYIELLAAQAARISRHEASAYVQQFKDDQSEINEHVRRVTQKSVDRYTSDANAKSSGKRVLWYVLARATKPKLIIEVGVKRGLGTCVLASALMRNASEGFPGKVIGIDSDPRAGCLIQPPFDQFASIHHGDCIDFLTHHCHQAVDFFIDDAIADPIVQQFELQALSTRLGNGAALSVNYHSSQLMNFATEMAKRYVVFQDEPLEHWYPGHKIAILF